MKPPRSHVTSFDVAALAGVSQSAVSRAFTPGASLSDEKRARILDAARTLHYVPNSIARSLTTKQSNMVALILGNIDNPFYVRALSAFIAKLQASNRHILTFTVDGDTSCDDAIMRVLRYQVDGVIVTAAQLSTRMTALCHDRGIPIVLFNRFIPGSDASVIRCDNFAGGRVMAEAFLKAGAKSFAVVRGDPMGATSQDRERGFIERLLEEGVKRRDIPAIDGHSLYDGAFEAIVRTYPRRAMLPDAIFCVNDIMAMAAMDALRETLGVSIPDDVMIGGFDDIPEARRWPYRLTTIRQPVDQMVDESVALLQLDDGEAPVMRGVDRRIPGALVERDTIRPAASGAGKRRKRAKS